MMANDQQTRDRWVQGLQHLIAMNSQKRQRYLTNDQRWISSYLAIVDRDKSKTLDRAECRLFLNDLLNVDLDEPTLDTFFRVTEISPFSSSSSSVPFPSLRSERRSRREKSARCRRIRGVFSSSDASRWSLRNHAEVRRQRKKVFRRSMFLLRLDMSDVRINSIQKRFSWRPMNFCVFFAMNKR